MKKVVMTAVGVLTIAGSANAQLLGTWYTDQTEWLSLVTNVRTAEYASTSSVTTPVIENGVTATKTGGGRLETSTYLTSSNANIPITFTFSGNAFSGQFGTHVNGSIDFSIDGSPTNIYNLTQTVRLPAASKFLGYISKSSSDISVTLTPSGSNILRVQSFSAANVAPEPGTLALAFTGGCALLGMYVRRRKAA